MLTKTQFPLLTPAEVTEFMADESPVRVRILVGGHLGECGTVTDEYRGRLTVTLDTGMMWYGGWQIVEVAR